MHTSELVAYAENNLKNATDGLKDFKATHLHFLKNKGLEAKDPEQYRYTNLQNFFNGFETTEKSAEIDLNLFSQTEIPTLTFVNGVLSSKVEIPGLVIKSLKDNFAEVSNIFEGDNALTHLHHSLLENGVILEIEKNTELKSPLRLFNIHTEGTLVAGAVFIKAARFSKATILEENIGQGETYARLSETYVHVAEGANLELVQIDRASSEALHHSSSFSHLAKDAQFRNVVLHLSGKMNRRNVEMKIAAPGAHGESFNLYLTNQSEHSDLHTIIHHLSADATSAQIAKGILDGESKGIFTGRIHIHPQAQRVNSSQLNKNLLLTKKAQVHSQPQLEIFADDVKCSHGSTTGQLSDDEVFYFEARGIPQDKARTLLAHGFGLEVVLKIQNEAVRKHVAALVMETLKTKFHLGGAQ